MSPDQITILAILGVTVGMFLWGVWRHDMVAMGALLACVVAGLVPATDAFSGFAHPAVITVACVLVLSQALQATGAVDLLARHLIPSAAGPTPSIAALTGVAALLSAFMNNVGALALLMPVGVHLASRLGLPPGKVLMPLAMGSILGGMTTLIGTPTNLIVSGFRAQVSGEGFGMFDFSPVGLAVAACGILFISLIGWRLVPSRERADAASFETGMYLTEVLIEKGSKADGRTLRDIGGDLTKADAQVLGLIRSGVRVTTPNPSRKLRVGDILIIESEPKSLSSALAPLGLKLVEDVRVESNKETSDSDKKTEETGETKTPEEEPGLFEVVVRPDGDLINRSATDIDLRSRFGINLLALSRQGKRTISRLRSARMRPGDVLLLQGSPGAITNFSNAFGCVPLAERALRLPSGKQALAAAVIMAFAVGGAAFGLLPAAISFAVGVLACLAFRILPLRSLYTSVDWPVIVLLGSLIPVAGAMASTGTADMAAHLLLDSLARGNPVIALALVLVLTMNLSDFMNNAATAAVMCPIAISVATSLEASPDSFLMAVALGASSAFLTPIGHQNSTLILGPGGFRFSDYWRLGLPMEILVVVVGLPTLLIIWPL